MESTAAARWFRLAAEFEEQSRLVRALELARVAALAVATLGIALASYNPRRFCDIAIHRRLDGFPVRHYSHDHLEEATFHAEALREKLETLSVEQFCEEFEIPIGLVVGEGSSEVVAADVEWIGIASDRRRTFWPTVS